MESRVSIKDDSHGRVTNHATTQIDTKRMTLTLRKIDRKRKKDRERKKGKRKNEGKRRRKKEGQTITSATAVL